MTPRTFRVNKHRSFQYYTPEDVAELRERLANAEAELATLRERTVVVGIDPGSPGGDRTTLVTIKGGAQCAAAGPAFVEAWTQEAQRAGSSAWGDGYIAGVKRCLRDYTAAQAQTAAADPIAHPRDDLLRIKANLPPSAADAFMRVKAHLTRGAKP